MTEKIEINGLKCVLSTNYGDTYCDTLNAIAIKEAIRWYDINCCI